MMEANDARRTVLIVDDTPDHISILNAALMEEYTIKVLSWSFRSGDWQVTEN